MYRFILTFIALFITLSLVTEVASAQEESIIKIDPAVAELKTQMRNRKTPSLAYWDKVAKCETGGNWKDGGNWSGGLGIAQSTWAGYGGRNFASKPSKATRIEQIVIANRIAIFGFQTKRQYRTLQDKLENNPFFRPPVGFFGWGCIKNNEYLHPKNRRKK
jgi:hypothetical protein